MEIFIHLSGGSTLNNFRSHENAVITLQGQEVSVVLSVSVIAKYSATCSSSLFTACRPPTARTPGAPVSATASPWWVAGWPMADQNRTPLGSINATHGQATAMKPSV